MNTTAGAIWNVASESPTVALAARQGYVTTLLGRRRPMPQLKSPEPRVRAARVGMAALGTPTERRR